MPKKTEATSNADADAADAGPFFSHTCVYIIMRYKSGISHPRLLPLKRCMPYYHLMRISRLMQTMLFRNFFNFLFPVLSSPSGFAAGLFIFFPSSFLFPVLLFSSLCPIYFSSLQIIKNTHVCEKKRPGSVASASEVFLRSLPFFILPFFAFPLLLSILFPIFVR